MKLSWPATWGEGGEAEYRGDPRVLARAQRWKGTGEGKGMRREMEELRKGTGEEGE